MLRIPTPKGSIEIRVFEKEAPLASRCFKQQIISGAWNNASFSIDESQNIVLGPAQKLVPKIRAENHKIKFSKRGLVAYASNTTSQLVFSHRKPQQSTMGTVIGEVVPKSLHILDAIAADLPNKTGKRRLEDSPVSAQLQQVLDFEKRLASV